MPDDVSPSTSAGRGQHLRLIQFPHPGFEYARKVLGQLREPQGRMAWKPGNSIHNRKYLITNGDVIDGRNWALTKDVTVGLWGEWEGPSDWVCPEDRVAPYHPSVFHRPFQPAVDPGGRSRQNTDPLVFGNHFVYSNCKQNRRPMQDLARGSVILFGRGMKVWGETCFVLDTCFVVDDFERTIVSPEILRPYGTDIVDDLVVGPLISEGAQGRSLWIYRGIPQASGSRPFSFFPAVDHKTKSGGFARPVIRGEGALEGRITDTLTMGMKPTAIADVDEATRVWEEVVAQVVRQGCLLGVRADRPPICEEFS